MANPSQYPEHGAPRLTRAVQALVALNVAILFLQWTVVSNADVFAVLGFQAGDLQRTLWSSLTYMFVHYGLAHLAVNMYVLLMFGPRLESAMGTRAFALYYLWCGLGGAVAHMLFVRTGMLVGSSAAVLGVMFGYAQQWSNEEVALFGVIPVRAWTMLMLFAIANLGLGMLDAGAVAGGDRLVYLAHLGGLAFGWLYFRTPPAASIERLRQRISPAPDYQDEAPPRAIPRTLPRQRAQRDEVDEIVAKSKAIAAQQRPGRVVITPVRTALEIHAAELDRVLDKISSKGLASLTADEHALLDATARRLRGEE
ncbi:MAG: rhomboid family intramembrane serine protease [Gemmatimonadota bacterium]|nr:rhomboid family intramembrane serine protease [Gemmatimonadota bacterium]